MSSRPAEIAGLRRAVGFLGRRRAAVSGPRERVPRAMEGRPRTNFEGRGGVGSGGWVVVVVVGCGGYGGVWSKGCERGGVGFGGENGG